MPIDCQQLRSTAGINCNCQLDGNPFTLNSPPLPFPAPTPYTSSFCQRKRKCTMARGKRRPPTTKARVYLLSKGMGHAYIRPPRQAANLRRFFIRHSVFQHSAFSISVFKARPSRANWAVGWHRSFQASYPFSMDSKAVCRNRRLPRHVS